MNKRKGYKEFGEGSNVFFFRKLCLDINILKVILEILNIGFRYIWLNCWLIFVLKGKSKLIREFMFGIILVIVEYKKVYIIYNLEF